VGNGGCISIVVPGPSTAFSFSQQDFTNCVSSGANGGGVYLAYGDGSMSVAPITLTSVNFHGCTAVGGHGGALSGIATASTIDHSSFAATDVDVVGSEATRGGGIDVSYSGSGSNSGVSFTDCTFMTCSASAGSGGSVNFAFGGSYSSATLSISNVEVD